MRIAITGASGLIGRALVASLRGDGHEVTRLVRSEAAARAPDAVFWSVAEDRIDAAGLEAHDAVVHLAGESLVGLWTESKKRRIRESRVRGTTLLARALAGLDRPPRALLSGSAIGIYGNRPPDVPLDETAAPGSGFLADVAQEWETATGSAEAAGIRVAHLRTGLVLSREGGALGPMLPLFKLGLGGKVGSGQQVWSWIALEDEVGAIRHLLDHDDLAGPVNLVAPEPVTNAEFTRTLGRVLGRPAWFTAPEFALRLVAGEMAEEMLLASQNVVPKRLLESGYRFRCPTLEGALRAMLG